MLQPEERPTLPESEWVWRWIKMSKSKGNVVTPDEMAQQYGADSLRLFGLFVAPFEETVQWTDKGIEAASSFVNRVWRLWTELRPHYQAGWRARPERSADSSAGHRQPMKATRIRCCWARTSANCAANCTRRSAKWATTSKTSASTRRLRR